MKDILTVSALNEQIKDLLEGSFPFVWVEGEISNLSRPASGHVYFTLKDKKSQIRAVIFRALPGQGFPPRHRTPQFTPEEGMSVVCRARLGVYPPRGEYQLIVDTVVPKGAGALQKAFEQLKARLEAEGLFEPGHKKPVPFLPGRIGVITSPTGAVIRDILNVTKRRCPSVNILIAPVRVQGTEAAGEIISAIDDMHAVGDIDVIILARGGGSLEDLAAFNDEGVAREIYRSEIPVISAVGHETDFTIADFVADLRAPTPSAAAELAVPSRKDLAAAVQAMKTRMVDHHSRLLDRLRERICLAGERLRDPRRRIADLRIAVDDRLGSLQSSFGNRMAVSKHQFLGAGNGLKHVNPLSLIRHGRLVLGNARKTLSVLAHSAIRYRKERAAADMAMLNSLSPLAVLERGYSIASTVPEGSILRNTASLAAGSMVDIRVAAGGFRAKVTDVYER
jgi:exodeoxyribonuclease VII large subunit